MSAELELHVAATGAAALDPSVESARMTAVERVVGLLRDIRIWSDIGDRDAMRTVELPAGIHTVRYYDASSGLIIAELTDDRGRPMTAFDLADALTWHVDYREQRWMASAVKSLERGTLDLRIEFVPQPA